ncbi:protein phosphatase methylesterase 1 [Martensiomyces pterosporus]|nr:protein phosphatase methylesterase 1 [Martensiomyces pterosporus]
MELPPLEHQVSNTSALQPLDWSLYFENRQAVPFGDTTFNVYSSGLDNTGPVFMFHHGAGHSGLTFGLVSKHIYTSSTPPNVTVVAPDCRAHGATSGDGQDDLSLQRLVDDFVGIFDAMFPDNKRDVVLVGHSMGGAVVTHVAASKRVKNILGLVVIDIVEGSAMDSLPSIPMFINARPKSFRSVEGAIQWHLESGSIQNPESARLSVPSLIARVETEGDSSCAFWRWRTSLLPTEKYWHGWYLGLSRTFVSAPTARLLVLAGTDRLDKELLIAQMQGKFQLELLPAAGHTIQEDLPDRVGDIILSFWSRNRRLNIPVRRFAPPAANQTSHQL